MSKSAPRYMPILLALSALALYLPGIWWGAPKPTAAAPTQRWSWGTDDLTPLRPLAELNNIIKPQPDRNLSYPLMHSFVISAAYAPYLSYLWLAGQLAGIRPTYPFGLVDPVGALKILTCIGHLVSALMGAGIVAAAYYTGRCLWNFRVGVLAAVLIMVSYPMFYYARTANVDVPMLFYVALSLLCLARSLKEGFDRRLAMTMGICAGCALATKEQALGLFLAFPIVLLYRKRPLLTSSSHRDVWNTWKPFVLLALTAFIAFGLGSGLFVDPERYFAHVNLVQTIFRRLKSGEVIWVQSFPNTLDGNLQLARRVAEYLVNTMTVGGLALAGIGVLWSAVKERSVSLFALPAVTYLAPVFVSARAVQLRYLLPVAYVLTFFAARAVFVCLDSRHSGLRAMGRAAALVVICVNLAFGADLTHAMIRDSRYAAGQWLEEHAKRGDRIEYFGSLVGLPPVAEGITLAPAIAFHGVETRPRIGEDAVQEILRGWETRKPEFVLIMPDLISRPGTPYSGTCPPAICEGLLQDRLSYRLAAYFETPSIFSWLRRPALDYPTVNPPIRIFVPSSKD